MSEKQNPPLAKFLQIKQEDKTFVRLLSKEQSSKSINNNNLQSGDESSFRVMYYGGATGSIPFRWESRPGTPKHALFSDTCSLPPLTPPPSYQFNSPSNSQEKGTQQKSKKFHTIFSKFGISSKKTNTTPISSSSSSSISSSSCSNSSSSYSFTSQKNAAPQSRSPLYVDDNNEHHHDQEHEHEHEPTRATSSRRRRHNRSLTFCCGSSMNDGRSNGFGGRRHLEVKSFRKGLLSIFATHATT